MQTRFFQRFLTAALARQPVYRQTTYVAPTINDIIYVKHLSPNTYGLRFGVKTYEFDKRQTIQELKALLRAEGITDISLFQAKPFAEYSENALLQDVVTEDFLLRIDHKDTYQVLAHVEDPPVLHTKYSVHYLEAPVFALASRLNLSNTKKLILCDYIALFMKELNEARLQKLDQNYLTLINEKVFMEFSLQAKSEIAAIDSLLALLYKRRDKLQEDRDRVFKRLQARSRLRLKLVMGFVAAQVAFTQYGTYVAYSWDIIEPIACLFGIMDLIIAYSFWLRTNAEYSYEEVARHYIQKRLGTSLERELIFQSEEEDLRKMIDYLVFKKLAFSIKLQEVMAALHTQKE